MKGLMVALLTLLTASFAAAQQEDDGGTFVLRLNEENFRALLQNEEGLIAPIPEHARGKITKVVVKLEDAVRNDEINRINSTKPSSQIPSLDPSTTARRPSVTQDGGFRNRAQDRSNDRGVQPSIQIPFRAPERFATDPGFEPVNQLGRANQDTFLPFGDDSDFAPVVNRDWLTRDRATLDRNGGLGQVNNSEGFRQPNNGLGQVNNNDDWRRQNNLTRQPEIPTFDQNRFQNNDRDRTNDLARRDLQIQDRNNFGARNQRDEQDSDLLQQYQNTLRDTQTMMSNQQTTISQKDAEIEKLRLQIIRERNEAARQAANHTDPLNQVVQDGRIGNSGSYTNYRNNVAQTGFDTPQQNRIARNDRQPNVNSNGVPTLQIQGNDDQPSAGDDSKTSENSNTIVNSELAGKNQSLQKANNFLLFMLLASVGLNIYLGLISRTFYTRYEELADELRETFTATM